MENTTVYQAKLRAVDKLAQRLVQATEALQQSFPLPVDTFDPESMDTTTSMALDAFRVRFSDLQDMLGRSLFPAIARFDEDETPAQPLTTRERTALMEKRGILDAAVWRELREIRNQFAHEYPDEHAEKAANLNAAWRLTGELLATARRAVDYAQQHHATVGQ